MTITRYSSRIAPLDESFLIQHLKGAKRYRRIAGYFTSSLFEVAGELVAQIPDVKIVCNADIRKEDLMVAQVGEARLLGRLNERSVEVEALLNRKRFRLLANFLNSHGPVIRVVPDELCGFVHGKAGVIDLADGRKIGFIGSMNESRNGWQGHYEILWSDESPEGVAWIEAEFDYLWRGGVPLPKAIWKEVARLADRHEVLLPDVDRPEDMAPAALIESPLYREGFALQPWQQGFANECVKHYQVHGSVRLLLADEVGLGKTLSLATAALALSLLESQRGVKKPVVIFAPATLCEQWQVELLDKLGLPCARWDSRIKQWLDHDEHAISPKGASYIVKCPMRIGIISTGLMMQDSEEKAELLNRRGDYGVVVLDEAHKARTKQGYGKSAGEANNLLEFARRIAEKADHVLLGTATPIQTRAEDLWDMVGILGWGAKGQFVLGADYQSLWRRPKDVLPILTGEYRPVDVREAWPLLCSPLPRKDMSIDPRAQALYSAIRTDLGHGPEVVTARQDAYLDFDDRDLPERIEDEIARVVDGASFFQRENPFVRHVVLRKRATLEDANLLKKIAVDVHPSGDLAGEHLYGFTALFEGLALRTGDDFREAYSAAVKMGEGVDNPGATAMKGFMKNLMAQRISSSIVAGIKTARKLLEGDTVADDECEDEGLVGEVALDKQRDAESLYALERLLIRLERIKVDPKFEAVKFYLHTMGWLGHGCIIFSQYYDTAQWVAESLARHYPDEPIGLYAGAGRSRLYQQGESASVERESLKRMVAERQMRLLVATDAACEGLNLQTLGTLINVDLPWNPTKLEQRIGRIKRFGQTRDSVDMLNLVNQETVDEKVYQRLSERMQDKFDLFGSLPDTIEADWINDIEDLGEKMDAYIEKQKRATGFDLRYNGTIYPDDKGWRDCSRVFSRRDLDDLMRQEW